MYSLRGLANVLGSVSVPADAAVDRPTWYWSDAVFSVWRWSSVPDVLYTITDARVDSWSSTGRTRFFFSSTVDRAQPGMSSRPVVAVTCFCQASVVEAPRSLVARTS